MALADTITALGTSIINLVGTRAKTDLSNITTAGQDVIKSLSSTSSIPVGTVIAYMGTSAPDGFLLMDGGEYSKTTYAALYAVVGDSMGTATDPTKFVIADMTDGRYLMGSTVAGSSVAQSLPNITGYTEIYARNTGTAYSGALYNENSPTGYGGYGATYAQQINKVLLNASHSSSVYKTNASVTPQSIQSIFLIKY